MYWNSIKIGLLILLLQAPVQASITTTGIFTGNRSEGFEGMPTSSDISVFGGAANLLSDFGIVTSSWVFDSTIFPFEGDYFYGSAVGPATFVFNMPVDKFGGYFGTNSVDSSTDAPDATINFYDTTDTLISSEDIVLGLGSTWTWNGWETDSGKSIQRIEIVGPEFGGAFVQMDALQASVVPEPASLLAWGLIGCCVANRRRVASVLKKATA